MSPQIYILVSICFLCVCNAFTPIDNYLIDCGSPTNTTINGRVFVADVPFASTTISTPRTVLANSSSDCVPSGSASALYRTARVFTAPSSYSFPIRTIGRHFVRLYFFPFVDRSYNLTTANFAVSAQNLLLMSQFGPRNGSAVVFKEYLLNLTSDMLVLSFMPLGESGVAFVNAIEVVSVPDDLVPDTVQTLSPSESSSGLSELVLETVYRINMGGRGVSPGQDTLWRAWISDQTFLVSKNVANFVNFSGIINYAKGGADSDTAPSTVYGTATALAASDVTEADFNVTWEFDVDAGDRYFVRMHFCDIVSKAPNELYFNVYVNGVLAIRNLDLSTIMDTMLAAPYYVDYVVAVSDVSGKIRDVSGKIRVSIGPSTIENALPGAILNGLEIMRLNISPDGFGVREFDRTKRNLGVILGSTTGAFVVAAAVCLIFVRFRRRKKAALNRHSKSWLPFFAYGHSSRSGSSKTTTSSSGRTNLGLQFPFAVIQDATNNFDENGVIGVGGFGKVYKGALSDGTKVAVKRGNPSSQQGHREFRTEIELLSRLRHRHLVSLIGYCDEASEMILVYEYMENGTLKGHLYGTDYPHLSWKQRLEACIGSAKGLHYLHTGSAKAIIHRDVKSANILLDDNLLAKVADFGLSKTGPDLDQTHVSTAVKGSFGYLDPEYFWRQQLTEKSDVYSFGVVMFEILCARPVIDPTRPRQEVNLAEWAMKLMRTGEFDQVIDPHLAGKIKSDSLRKFVETAEKCLAEYSIDRPTMGDVLWNLEYALQLHEAAPSSFEEDSISRIEEFSAQLKDIRSNADATGVAVAAQLQDIRSNADATGVAVAAQLQDIRSNADANSVTVAAENSCRDSQVSINSVNTTFSQAGDSEISVFSQLMKTEGR